MSANIVPWQTRFGRIVGKPEAIRKTGLGVTSAAGLVSGIALINSLPVRSNDADFFAADASKLYRQSNEAIFLFLIIGSEGILVHDDKRVSCARHALAKSGRIFSTTAMRLASFLASSVWFPFNIVSTSWPFIESRHPAVGPIKPRGWRFHPLKRKDLQEAVLNSYLIRSLRIWPSSLFSIRAF